MTEAQARDVIESLRIIRWMLVPIASYALMRIIEKLFD